MLNPFVQIFTNERNVSSIWTLRWQWGKTHWDQRLKLIAEPDFRWEREMWHIGRLICISDLISPFWSASLWTLRLILSLHTYTFICWSGMMKSYSNVCVCACLCVFVHVLVVTCYCIVNKEEFWSTSVWSVNQRDLM